MTLPGPLGRKAVAIAALMAVLNVYSVAASGQSTAAVLVAVPLAAGASYGWVYILRTIVRVIFGAGEGHAGA